MIVRRVFELVGVFVLVAGLTTCGLMTTAASGRTVAVSQNPDGTISVTEAAPWWGPGLFGLVSAAIATAAGVYLNNREPPRRTPP